MPAPAASALVVQKLFTVRVVSTEEFLNQNPGQLGLFLPKSQFKRKHFVENYIQAVFDAFGPRKITGSTIVVGTDASPLALSITRSILRLAAGNAVGRVIVGVGARLSAPALSVILREQETVLGFFLSGDGGREEEEEEGVAKGKKKEGATKDEKNRVASKRDQEDKFAIQTFMGSGGLASEEFNQIIFKKTRYITKYRLVNEFPEKLFDAPGSRETFVEGRSFTVEVVDPVDSYMNVLSNFFDFNMLRLWNHCYPKRVVIGTGGGQMGLYAKKIFGDVLGVRAYCFVETPGAWKQADKIGDAQEIVKTLREDTWDFGVSLSPDGRRCAFFCSNGLLINPGNILGLLAEKSRFLPGLMAVNGVTGEPATTEEPSSPKLSKQSKQSKQEEQQQQQLQPTQPPKGFARTVTTSGAVDQVAKKRGVEMHVTPPEWRHMNTLLDAGRVAIFGDDSFQMGSFHARVPDGIWTTLALMTILAVAEAQAGGAIIEEEEDEEEGEEKKEKSGKEGGEEEETAGKERDVDTLPSIDLPSIGPPSLLPPGTAPPSGPPSGVGNSVICSVNQYYLSLMTEGAALTGEEPPPTPPRVRVNPLRSSADQCFEDYGRHLAVRLDYESLSTQDALKIYEALQIKIRSPILFVHAWFHYGPHSYQVIHGEEFQYFDPVELTTTLTTNCIRLFLHDGSIIVFRLCSAEDGLNFRICIDKFEDSVYKIKYSREATLLPLIEIAEEMCGVRKKTRKRNADSTF